MFDAAKAALSGVDLTLEAAVLVRSPEVLRRYIEDWKKQGMATIFVGGGDGTQAAAAEHLAGSDIRQGVLPLGTGNALARDLHIPDNIQLAVQLLVSGHEGQIDLGLANGKIFINVATLGLTATIVRHLNAEAKKRFGKLAYLPAAFHAAASVRPFHADIETDQGEFHGRAVQVVVGCGVNHGGPFPISRHSSQSSGTLSAYAVPYQGKAGLLRFAWQLLRRQHVQSSEIWFAEASQITVETRPRRTIVVDGELRQKSPLNAKVLPAALWVLKPSE